MLYFKINSPKGEEFVPQYQTSMSACFDFMASEDDEIEPGSIKAVPTGCYFDVEYNKRLMKEIEDKSCVPVLRIYVRSSLAYKHGILLANGVGIIDFDYPNEIKALLYNSSNKAFKISAKDRICQGLFDYSWRSPLMAVKDQERTGGFGSTQK